MDIHCMLFCTLVLLLAVAPTFIEGTDCENATSRGSEDEAWVYTCNAWNKDITIKWIKQEGNIQRILSTCEGNSTTCLNTGSSVFATRSEDGRSELRFTSSCQGEEYNSTIECHEVNNSLETRTRIKVHISRHTSSTRRSAKTTSVHNASTPTAASKGENSSVSRGPLGNLSHAASGQANTEIPASSGEAIENPSQSPTMVRRQDVSGMSEAPALANGSSTISLLTTSTDNPVTQQMSNSSYRTVKEILALFTSANSLSTMSEGIPFTKDKDNVLNTVTSLEKETLGEKTNPTVSFTPDTNRTSDDTATPSGNHDVREVSSSIGQPHVTVSPVTVLDQPTGDATFPRESSEVTAVGLAYSGSPKVTEGTWLSQTGNSEVTATTRLNPSESSEVLALSRLTQKVSSEITGVTGSTQDRNYQGTASTGLNYKSDPNVTVTNGLTYKNSFEVKEATGSSPKGSSQAATSLEPSGSVSSALDSSLITKITEISPPTIVSVTPASPTELESAGLEATFRTESDASQSSTDVSKSTESSLVTTESQGNASAPTPSVALRTSVYVTPAAEVQSPSGMPLGSTSMTDVTADARNAFTQSLVSGYTSSTRSPVEETESSINIFTPTVTPTEETSSVSPVSSSTTSEGITFTKDSDIELNSVTFMEKETLGEKTNPTVSFTPGTNRTSADVVSITGYNDVQAVPRSAGQSHIGSVSPFTVLDQPTSNATLSGESSEVTTVGLAYSGRPKVTQETGFLQTDSSELTATTKLNSSGSSGEIAPSGLTQKVNSEITGVTGSVQKASYQVTTSTGLIYKNSPNVAVTAELTYDNSSDVTGSTGLSHKSGSNITVTAESTYIKSYQVTAATGVHHNSSSKVTVTTELTYDDSSEVEETESSINIITPTSSSTEETSSVSTVSLFAAHKGISFTKEIDNKLNTITTLEKEKLGEKTNPTVSFTADTNGTSEDTVTLQENHDVQTVSSSTGQPQAVTLRRESFQVTTVELAYSGSTKVTKETRLSQTGSSERTGGSTLNPSESSDVMASSWLSQVNSEITGVTGSVQKASYQVTTSTGLIYKNSPNVAVTAELTYDNSSDVTGSTGLNNKSSSNITVTAESTYGKSYQVTAATGSSSKGSSKATTSELTRKNSSQVTASTGVHQNSSSNVTVTEGLTYDKSSQVTASMGVNHNSGINVTVTAGFTYDKSFEVTAATSTSKKGSSDTTTFVEPSASVTSAQDSSLNTIINVIRTQQILISLSKGQVVTSATPTVWETSEPVDTVYTKSDASQSPTDVPTSRESSVVTSESQGNASTLTPSVNSHTSVTTAADVKSPSGMTFSSSAMSNVTAHARDTFTQRPDLSSARSPVEVTQSSLNVFTPSGTRTDETSSVSRCQLDNQSHKVAGQASNTEIPASSEDVIEISSQSPTIVRREDVSGISEALASANGRSTVSLLTTSTDNPVTQQKSNNSLQTMTGISAPLTSFVSLSVTSEGITDTKETDKALYTVTSLEKETLGEKTNPTVSFTSDTNRTSDDTVTHSGNPDVQAVTSSTGQPFTASVSPVTDLEQSTGNATLHRKSSEVTTVGLTYGVNPNVRHETGFRQFDSSEMTATTSLNPSESSEVIASSWLTQKVSSEITGITGLAQEGNSQVTTSTGFNYKNSPNVTLLTELTYENSSRVTVSRDVNHNSSFNVTVTAGLTYDNRFEVTAATSTSQKGSSDTTTFVEPSASVPSAQDSSLNTKITDIRTPEIFVSVSEGQVVTSATPAVWETSKPVDTVRTESDASQSPTDVPTSTESSVVTSESQGNASTPTPSVDLQTSVMTAADVQSPSEMTYASSAISNVTAHARDTFTQSRDLSSTRSPVGVTESSLQVFTSSVTRTDETSSVSRGHLDNQSYKVPGQASNTEIPASSEEAIEISSQSPTIVRREDVSGISEALASANGRSTVSLLTTSTDNPVTQQKSNNSLQTMTGISAPLTSFVSLSVTSEGITDTKETDKAFNTVTSLEKETLGEKTNPTVSFPFDTNRTSDDTVTHSGNPDVQAVSSSTGQPLIASVSPVTDLEQSTGNATLHRKSSEVTTVGLAYGGSPNVTQETGFRQSDSSEMTATTSLNPSESSEVIASSWLTQKVSSEITGITGSAQEGSSHVRTSTGFNYKNSHNVTVLTELTYENSSRVTVSRDVNHNSSFNETVTAGLTYDNRFEVTAATSTSQKGSSDATTFVEPSASANSAQDSSLNTKITDIGTPEIFVSVSEGQIVTSATPTVWETSKPVDIVRTESDASQSPTDVPTSRESSVVTSESQGNASTPTPSVDLHTSVTTAADVQSPSGMTFAFSAMSNVTAHTRDTFTPSPDLSSAQSPVEVTESSLNVFTPSVTRTDETSSVSRGQLGNQSHKVPDQASSTEIPASSEEAIEISSQSPTIVRREDVSGISEALASANGRSTVSLLTTSTDNPVTQQKSNNSLQTMTGISAPLTSFVSLSVTSEGITDTKETDKAFNTVTSLEKETLGEKTNPTVSFPFDTNRTSDDTVTHSGNPDVQAVSSSTGQPLIASVSPVTDLEQSTGNATLHRKSSEVTTVGLAYGGSPNVTQETGFRQSDSSEMTATTSLNPSESSEVIASSWLTQKVSSEITGITGSAQEGSSHVRTSTGFNYKNSHNVTVLTELTYENSSRVTVSRDVNHNSSFNETVTAGLTYDNRFEVTAATSTSQKGSSDATTFVEPSASANSAQDSSLNTKITDIGTPEIFVSVSEGQIVTSATPTVWETSKPVDIVRTESDASQSPTDVPTSRESSVVTSESQGNASTPTPSVDLHTSVTTAADVQSPSGMTFAFSAMSNVTAHTRDTFTPSPDLSSAQSPVEVTESSLNVFTPSVTRTDETSSVSRGQLGNQSHKVPDQASSTEIPASSEEAIEISSQSPTIVRREDVSGISEALASANGRSTVSLLTTSTDNPVTQQKSNNSLQTMTGISAPLTSILSLSITSEGITDTKETDKAFNTVTSLEKETLGEKTNPTVSFPSDTNRTSDDTVTHSGNPDVQAVSSSTGQPLIASVSPVTDLEQPADNATLHRKSSEVTTVGFDYGGSPNVIHETGFRQSDSSEMTATTSLNPSESSEVVASSWLTQKVSSEITGITGSAQEGSSHVTTSTGFNYKNSHNVTVLTELTYENSSRVTVSRDVNHNSSFNETVTAGLTYDNSFEVTAATSTSQKGSSDATTFVEPSASANSAQDSSLNTKITDIGTPEIFVSVSEGQIVTSATPTVWETSKPVDIVRTESDASQSPTDVPTSRESSVVTSESQGNASTPTPSVDLHTSVTTAADVQSPSGMTFAFSAMSNVTAHTRDTFTPSPDLSSAQSPVEVTESSLNVFTPSVTRTDETSSVSRGQLGNQSHKVPDQASNTEIPASSEEAIEISSQSPTIVRREDVSGISEALASANGRSTVSLLTTSTDNPVTQQKSNNSLQTMTGISAPLTSIVSLSITSEGITDTKETDKALSTVTSLEKETLGEKTNPTVSFPSDTNRTSDDTVTHAGNPDIQAVSSSTDQPHVVTVSPVTDLDQQSANAPLRSESSEITTVGLTYSGSPKVTEETGLSQIGSSEVTATITLNPSESFEVMTSSRLTQKASSEITGVTGLVQEPSTGLNHESNSNVTVTNGLTYKHSSDVKAATDSSQKGSLQTTTSLKASGSMISTQDRSLNTEISDIETQTLLFSVSEGQVVTSAKPTGGETSKPEDTVNTDSDVSQSPTDVLTSTESSLVTSESQDKSSTSTPSVDLRTSEYVTTTAEVLSRTDVTADVRDTFTQSSDSRSLTTTQRSGTVTSVSSRVDGTVYATDSEITPPPIDSTPKDAHYVTILTGSTDNESSLTTENAAVQSQTALSNTFAIDSAPSSTLANRTPHTSETISTTAAANNQSHIYTTQENTTQNKFVTTETPSTRVQEYTSAVTLSSLLQHSFSFNTLHRTDVTSSDSSWKSSEVASNDNSYTALPRNKTSASVPGSPFSENMQGTDSTVKRNYNQTLATPTSSKAIPSGHTLIETTLGSSTETHDTKKGTSVAVIAGVVSAVVVALVMMGTAYIFVRKRRMKSITLSHDLSKKCETGYIYYGDFSLKANNSDDVEKGRGAQESHRRDFDVAKNKELVELRTYRSLTPSQTCVLLEEIESPYSAHIADTHSVGTRSIHSASNGRPPQPMPSALATDDTQNDKPEIYAVINITDFQLSSCEQVSRTQEPPDEKDDGYFPDDESESPCAVRKAKTVGLSPGGSASRARFPTDSKASEDSDYEDLLSATYAAINTLPKPSTSRGDAAKLTDCLSVGDKNENDSDPIYATVNKPKRQTNPVEDYVYASVNKMLPKPKEQSSN